MSLLREIQDAAASPSVRVADLLRKCKILAARLKSEELARWVDKELDGYDNGDDFPPYRNLKSVESKGNFFGPFGASIENGPIPRLALPKFAQEDSCNFNLKAGVQVYEDLLNTGEGSFRVEWSPYIAASLSNRVYQGYGCLQAWRIIERGALVRVLDTVRNRILGFALDIEQRNPEAGEADVNTVPVPPPVVHHAVNNHFYSSVGNVASDSHQFEQHATMTHVEQQANFNYDPSEIARELAILKGALLAEAIEPEHYQAIAEVTSAEKEVEKQNPPKVLEHLSRAGKWALNKAEQIGTTILVEYMKRHMGH